MKKIKILFLISTIDVGGAEVLLLNLCRGLLEKDKNFEIKVLTYFEGNALKSDFDKIGVQILCLNLPKASSIQNICRKLLLTYYNIMKYKPDVVHTQLLDTDRYGQIASFFAGVKKRFCTVHNIEINETFGFRVTRYITGLFATKIIFVAKCAMDHYCLINSYPSKKCSVINNAPGFRDQNFLPKSFDPLKKNIRIVNVARLHPQKGQYYLIKAMKLLENMSSYTFELELFGRDYEMYKSLLENELARSEIKNVFFKGVTNDVISVLKNADIFISSSIYEAAPLVILEAITVGIPIIATDIPPHREILESVKDYNLFVPVEDPVAISQAVINLVNNPKYYSEISERLICRSKDFSQEKLIDNYHNLYLLQ